MRKASDWRPFLPHGMAANELMASWLHERGSLTRRLMRQGSFRVQKLFQGYRCANADECAVLGIPPNTPCHVREVLLYCNGVATIFAHTVLPAHPRGRLSRWFSRLGNRSLGSLLFVHPGFRRGPLFFASLTVDHPLYVTASINTRATMPSLPSRLPARRCLHRLGHQSLLVTELFLPTLPKQSAA